MSQAPQAVRHGWQSCQWSLWFTQTGCSLTGNGTSPAHPLLKHHYRIAPWLTSSPETTLHHLYRLNTSSFPELSFQIKHGTLKTWLWVYFFSISFVGINETKQKNTHKETVTECATWSLKKSFLSLELDTRRKPLVHSHLPSKFRNLKTLFTLGIWWLPRRPGVEN
jgi:hypothetical protein